MNATVSLKILVLCAFAALAASGCRDRASSGVRGGDLGWLAIASHRSPGHPEYDEVVKTYRVTGSPGKRIHPPPKGSKKIGGGHVDSFKSAGKKAGHAQKKSIKKANKQAKKGAKGNGC